MEAVKYYCAACRYEHPSRGSVAEHVASEHNNMYLYICRTCNYKCFSAIFAAHHSTRKHADGMIARPPTSYSVKEYMNLDKLIERYCYVSTSPPPPVVLKTETGMQTEIPTTANAGVQVEKIVLANVGVQASPSVQKIAPETKSPTPKKLTKRVHEVPSPITKVEKMRKVEEHSGNGSSCKVPETKRIPLQPEYGTFIEDPRLNRPFHPRPLNCPCAADKAEPTLKCCKLMRNWYNERSVETKHECMEICSDSDDNGTETNASECIFSPIYIGSSRTCTPASIHSTPNESRRWSSESSTDSEATSSSPALPDPYEPRGPKTPPPSKFIEPPPEFFAAFSPPKLVPVPIPSMHSNPPPAAISEETWSDLATQYRNDGKGTNFVATFPLPPPPPMPTFVNTSGSCVPPFPLAFPFGIPTPYLPTSNSAEGYVPPPPQPPPVAFE